MSWAYTDTVGRTVSFDRCGDFSDDVHIRVQRPNVIICIPAHERPEAAQALAGPDYRVVPRDLTVGDLAQIARDAGVKLDMDLREQDEIPPFMLADLWQALGCGPDRFDEWHARHGSTNTWSQLLAIVRRKFRPVCGEPVDGEYCVLTAPLSEDADHICHGPSDVGAEELPPIPAQPDRPEPVDPASVRVGDLAQIAKVTPCSCSAQRARANKAEAETERLRNEIGRLRDRCQQLYTEANHARLDRPEPVDPSEICAGDRVEVVITGTVQGVGGGAVDLISDDSTGIGIIDNYSETTWRVLHPAEPEPDEAAVEALTRKLKRVVPENGDWVAWDEVARGLIRDGGVQVEVPTDD